MKYLTLLVFPVLLFSCKSNLPENPELRLGTSYYPLQTTQYSIYKIEQKEYKLNGSIVDSVFYLKEVVVDSFLNQEGTYTYFLHRFYQKDNDWEFLETWSVKKSAINVRVQKGNVAYIKLAFPFKNNLIWDGNGDNTLEEELYTMDSVEQNFSFQDYSFKNTTTIVHANVLDNILFKDYRAEVYADGKGLVYREEEVLEYCSLPSCLGQFIIITGLLKKQILIESGKE